MLISVKILNFHYFYIKNKTMKKVLLFILYPFFLFGQTQIGQDLYAKFGRDRFGISVDLSSDGNIIAIGAHTSDANGVDSGQVTIYKNVNGIWTQIGQDINGESSGDQFGGSLSLNSNGNVIAIGAEGNNNNSGHVRIYENINNNWIQLGQDIDGEAERDFSGSSVSLSSDGTIVAIGARANDGNGNESGHTRVYNYNNNIWYQLGEDIDGESSDDRSGYSVSLSSDGNILAIGAIQNDENGNNSGHVRIYKNINNNWIQIGQDINGESSNDLSGYSVSLNSNGSIIAIGAIQNDVGFNSTVGHVRVYKNINDAWTQIGEDINGEAERDFSGYSVSLSSDGNIIAIGAVSNDGNGKNNTGHVRIYKNVNNKWIKIGSDIDGLFSEAYFGEYVSLSSDGNILVAGGVARDNNKGYVQVYNLSQVLSTKNNTSENNFTIYPNPTSKQFTIQINNSEFKKASIYNSLGQFVKSSKKLVIDISTLSKGIYLLQVETKQGKASKKLIIE